MHFGSVFTMLCSVALLCGSVVHAQVDIPANLEFESSEAEEAYKDYILRFDECHDKETRKNNPYPINDWLISLPRAKQISVISYLHHLAEYNCLLDKQNFLIGVLNKYNESKVLRTLESEGWFDAPIYGYSYIKEIVQSQTALSEDDKKKLNVLINLNYLPFNGVELDQIIRKLNQDIEPPVSN